MSDHILRDEIWESDRYLDLQTDTQRLAFMRLLSMADDFGNLEGGVRRIYRVLTRVMHVKTPEETAAVLSALADCDLIRVYAVSNDDKGERELIHIPRFRTHRNYRVRKVPPSPWCCHDAELGKFVRLRKQGLAKDIPMTSQQRSSDVAATQQECSSFVSAGVGVGVGVGVEEKLSTGTTGDDITNSDAATRRGALAGMLRQLGVKVTSQDPRLIAMAAQGVTNQQVHEAVDRARLHKDGQIPMGYLEPIVRDVVAGKGGSKGPSWWTSHEAIDRKGRELGMTAGAYEDYPAYAHRIKQEIARRHRDKVR